MRTAQTAVGHALPFYCFITMEKITDKDKIMHFAVCLAISMWSTEAAVGAALGKEYGDKNATGNHWCWLDLLADGIGIAIGTTIRVLIAHRWNWY